MASSPMGVTAQLAEFALTTDPVSGSNDDLRQHAAYCLLDWFGCALGASQHETTRILLDFLKSVGGNEQAGVVGHPYRTDAPRAALANGVMGHVHDFDDTHLKTVLHPSGPVSAGLLAVAELASADGRSGLRGGDLLDAFLVGYEVEARVAMALYPSHYDRGWHITGTAGTFGATAAAGRLLQLHPGELTQAFGVSASQAAGLREMFGTMTKPFHAGKAASNGVLSVLLARRGFTSSVQGLEAPRGFMRVLSENPDFDVLTQDLGRRWEIRDNAVKPYPCGVVTHPIIDGVLRLRERYHLGPDRVRRITAHVHPLVVELTGKLEPSSGLEGKFSVYHCAAVALVDGVVLPPQFTDERVCDPEVVAVRKRVDTVVVPAIREDEAIVEIETEDGGVVEEHVLHATGSKDNPMDHEQLLSKFRGLARPVVGEAEVDRLAHIILSLNDREDFDVRELWESKEGNQ